MRSKAWSRRRENVTGVDIGKTLTAMKQRIAVAVECPAELPSTVASETRTMRSSTSSKDGPGIRNSSPSSAGNRPESPSTPDTWGRRTRGAAARLKLPQLGTVKLKGRKLPSAMLQNGHRVEGHHRPVLGIVLGDEARADKPAPLAQVRRGRPRHAIASRCSAPGKESRIRDTLHAMRHPSRSCRNDWHGRPKASKRRTRTTKRIAKLHARIACSTARLPPQGDDGPRAQIPRHLR